MGIYVGGIIHFWKHPCVCFRLCSMVCLRLNRAHRVACAHHPARKYNPRLDSDVSTKRSICFQPGWYDKHMVILPKKRQAGIHMVLLPQKRFSGVAYHRVQVRNLVIFRVLNPLCGGMTRTQRIFGVPTAKKKRVFRSNR